MSILIRPYQVSDRPAVRQICADTADRGGPVENFFPDRGIFADLVTSYYTDFEPGSLWVAVLDGQAVGYLSGCLDSRRYLFTMALRIFPKVAIRAILRGIFFRKEVWRLIVAGCKSAMRGGFKRGLPLDKYPAHLHIDIQDGFRGKELGRRMMEEFFAQASSSGSKGIHLVTLEANNRACRFFERLGFSVFGKYPVYVPARDGLELNYSILYVKQL